MYLCIIFDINQLENTLNENFNNSAIIGIKTAAIVSEKRKTRIIRFISYPQNFGMSDSKGMLILIIMASAKA
jgi:hypothetical protein